MYTKRRNRSTSTGAMTTITVRDLPRDVYESLCVRAAHNGCSVEEEARHIVEQTASDMGRSPTSPGETREAVKCAQEYFAPMRERYSVEKFLAEKHEEAAAEFSRDSGE